jgi:hypothetical protein
MSQRRIGSYPLASMFAACVLGVGIASAAAARDGGPSPPGIERPLSRGGIDDRSGPASGFGERLDPLSVDAFARGYLAGRNDERARIAGHRMGPSVGSRVGPRIAWNDAEQNEAYEALERAAIELRRALLLIHRHPSLPHVQAALVQARDALERTQNALTWLPPLPDRNGSSRYPRVRGIGPERASGGWEG